MNGFVERATVHAQSGKQQEMTKWERIQGSPLTITPQFITTQARQGYYQRPLQPRHYPDHHASPLGISPACDQSKWIQDALDRFPSDPERSASDARWFEPAEAGLKSS